MWLLFTCKKKQSKCSVNYDKVLLDLIINDIKRTGTKTGEAGIGERTEVEEEQKE